MEHISLFYAACFEVLRDAKDNESSFPYAVDVHGKRTYLTRSELVGLRDALNDEIGDRQSPPVDTLTIYSVEKPIDAIRFIRCVGTLRGRPLGLREAKDAMESLRSRAVPSIKILDVPVAARSVIEAAAKHLGVILEPPAEPFIPPAAVL